MGFSFKSISRAVTKPIKSIAKPITRSSSMFMPSIKSFPSFSNLGRIPSASVFKSWKPIIKPITKIAEPVAKAVVPIVTAPVTIASTAVAAVVGVPSQQQAVTSAPTYSEPVRPTSLPYVAKTPQAVPTVKLAPTKPAPLAGDPSLGKNDASTAVKAKDSVVDTIKKNGKPLGMVAAAALLVAGTASVVGSAVTKATNNSGKVA